MEESKIIPHKHNAVSRFVFSRPIQSIPNPREHSIQDTSLWSRFFWNWIGGLLRRGYDRVIMPADIPFVPKADAMKIRFGEYKAYLSRHKPTPHTHYREIWALLYALRYRLLLAFGLKLLTCACQIGMSVVSRKLIEEAELITEHHGVGSHGKVSGYTVGTCAMDSLMLISDLTSIYYSIMNSEYARTLMMSCIHDKMLRLGPQQRHDYSAAKIMTISSSDCRRASTVFIQINALLVLPVNFGATLGILIYMIGVSGLPGVGILLVGLVISAVASFYAASLRLLSMPYQDRRVSLTRETLKNINIIKFYGWEESFLKLIHGLRAVETRYIRFLEMLDAFNVAILLAAPNLAGALSFAVKIIISSSLSPSRAFPSLTLFQMFTPILAEVSFALTTIADAAVAARRLDAFFRLPEVPSYIESFEPEDKNSEIVAAIENGTFSWVIDNKLYGSSEALDTNTEENADLKEKFTSDVQKNQLNGPHISTDSLVSESTNDEKTILADVNFALHKGTMNLVIGSVGTGKTSLLNTFVNLIPKSSGAVKIRKTVRTTSVLSLWSQSCNIRDNILFGLDFDAKKYHEVVRICDLQSDFDLLSHGDMTAVGENGVTLSGGQRARLALARCLYADGDLIILDDVLSAMDSRVGNHIYRELLKLAHEAGKTVLFSTNNLKLISQADYVLSLSGSGAVEYMPAKESPHFLNNDFKPGEIKAELNYQEEQDARALEVIHDEEVRIEQRLAQTEENHHLQEKTASSIAASQLPSDTHDFAALSASGMVDGSTANIEDFKKNQLNRQSINEKFDDVLHPDSTANVALAHPAGDAEMNGDYEVTKQGANQMDEENRAVGSVRVSVLIRYFRLNRPWGLLLGILLLLSVICFATSEAMANVVLNWWTSDRFHKSPGFNLGMYTLDVSLVAVFYAIFANLLSFTATASSTVLHNSAVRGLYRAPMAFFQKNPLGRLMMRFTEDMVNLDTQLLAFARITAVTLFSLLASVIVVFVYIPWVILCLLPIFILSFVLMTFYRTTSREINRCMRLFDSRGMASVSEHIDGQEVIVAFHQEEESQTRLNDRMDDVISATLCNEAANFWMALRGGIMCEIINVVAIFLACFQIFHLNASEVGTIISILPAVRLNLTMFFPMYALFDNQLNSVERLDEYASDVPIEGAEVSQRTKADLEDWSPTKGAIDFHGVSLRYQHNLPLALNNFSAHLGGGKKVGICGRTGAGKSTSIAALFRLVELSSGTITIDGQDISELPLTALRRALAIIPQQPVLFQGTIRSNLDPFQEKSDEQVLNALKQSGLNDSEDATTSSFTLSTHVEAEGSNFSFGQRQMLALARVILRDSKILVLDEATAAVDLETDEKIQRTLKSVFRNHTVLCIAHRLETILDYDEILVMGPGGIKLEMGPPRDLWNNPNSAFRQMCDEAGVGF